MVKVNLFSPSFTYYKSEGLEMFFKGSFIYDDELFNHAETVAGLLMKKLNAGTGSDLFNVFKEYILKCIYGIFSLIIVRNNSVLLVSDIIRSQPIFVYNNSDKEIIVTDSLG